MLHINFEESGLFVCKVHDGHLLAHVNLHDSAWTLNLGSEVLPQRLKLSRAELATVLYLHVKIGGEVVNVRSDGVAIFCHAKKADDWGFRVARG